MQTKNKFTPGPWYAEEKNPDEFEINAGEGGIEIAFVSINPQSKENAFVLAAAPDMLECIIEAEAQSRKRLPVKKETWLKMLATISKARGE
jgi:hypothetical protein